MGLFVSVSSLVPKKNCLRGKLEAMSQYKVLCVGILTFIKNIFVEVDMNGCLPSYGRGYPN